jgi:hypothetical protein
VRLRETFNSIAWRVFAFPLVFFLFFDESQQFEHKKKKKTIPGLGHQQSVGPPHPNHRDVPPDD